jgi:hypothetical protein
MSSREGGQSVSHVLQWNTSAPDFSSASNSPWLNLTVWSWSFGQTISNFIRSLMSLLLRGQWHAAPARSVSSVYGSASTRLPILSFVCFGALSVHEARCLEYAPQRSSAEVALLGSLLLAGPVFPHSLGLLLALRRGEGTFLPGGGSRSCHRGNRGKRILRWASPALRWPLQGFYRPVQSISFLNQKRQDMFCWHRPDSSMRLSRRFRARSYMSP